MSDSIEMLDGVAFDSFRSFPHGELQYFGPLGRLNVIVGPNNSGKSNVLRLLSRVVPTLGSGPNPPGLNVSSFEPLDPPLGNNRLPIRVLGFPLVRGKSSWERLRALVLDGIHRTQERIDPSLVLEQLMGVIGVDDTIWPCVDFSVARTDSLATLTQHLADAEKAGLDRRILEVLAQGATWRPDNPNRNRLAASALLTAAWPPRAMPVVDIPATRGLDPRLGSPVSGDFLAWIRDVQNPSFEHRDSKQATFKALNDLVSNILESPASLHMPAVTGVLEVTINNRTLPVVDLGSGIEQTVYLAIKASQAHESLVLIEEPEIHLHPHLLLQLVRYLLSETSNQYVVTTHAAVLLDHPEASIFSVTMHEGASRLRQLQYPADRHGVVHSLGYRPSDMVHANAVVWVEGPSDRFYVNWWLQCAQSGFVEGIDYQIMFYGGRLLANVTIVDDEFAEDFVRIQNLNRMVAILIDSDRDSASDRVNSTKQRIIDEIPEPGFAWLTEGREIENYLPRELLAASIKSVDPSQALPKSWHQFSRFKPVSGGRFNKVEIARHLTISNSPDQKHLSVLDLAAKVARLIEFIDLGRRWAGRDAR